jgi:transcriptional regulator with XRE-family HTH domain
LLSGFAIQLATFMTSKTVTERSSLNGVLEIIGKKLFELRIQKGYTSHADFAADYDLPRIQYWRMEKGKANMTIKSLHKVLAIHDLTVEDLFHEVLKEGKK